MPPAAIADEFGVEVDAATVAAPRFNVCPSEDVLVLARGATGPSLGWMRWGLVPWFARDVKDGPRSINARAETIATARLFREAFQRRRCLVVADGFYEWRKERNERQPPGVWERWTGTGQAPLLSCAIVTCPANEIVAPVHGRMPVIVPPEARATWLAADARADELGALLRPHPADVMERYPVSPLVNAPRNDGPECIRPLASGGGEATP
jgi:putative SOS response-associated peptidase YedK